MEIVVYLLFVELGMEECFLWSFKKTLTTELQEMWKEVTAMERDLGIGLCKKWLAMPYVEPEKRRWKQVREIGKVFNYLKAITQQRVHTCIPWIQGTENNRDLCSFKHVGEGGLQVVQTGDTDRYVHRTEESLLTWIWPLTKETEITKGQAGQNRVLTK